MTNQKSGVQVMASESDITEVASEVVKPGMSSAELQKQIERIASNKLKELLQRESELHAEIDAISSMDGESEKMEMIQANLKTVRAEIAKRGEDLASLSYAIAAEMETFGQLSGAALQDTDEDIAKRQKAHDAVTVAQEAITKAKSDIAVAESQKQAAESRKTKLEGSLFSFLKGSDIAAAQDDIDRAQAIIDNGPDVLAKLQEELRQAEDNIPVVEEQIQLDKRTRIKSASLEKTYATIAQWVSQAKKVLKKDIAEYQTRVTETKKSRQKAIDRRLAASKRKRAAEEKIDELMSEYAGFELERDDITDRTDPEYQRLSSEMERVAVELDAARNEKKLAEGGFSDAEIAIKERTNSYMTLMAQQELAKNQFNKFVMSEETAREVGQNIEVIVKGTTREMLNESLDKGVHKMTVAVYDLSKKSAISSVRQLNDMQDRKIEILKRMEEMDAESDVVLSQEQERYQQLAETLKAGYAKQGLDVDGMSSLQAAANLAKQVGGVESVEKSGDEMF